MEKKRAQELAKTLHQQIYQFEEALEKIQEDLNKANQLLTGAQNIYEDVRRAIEGE